MEKKIMSELHQKAIELAEQKNYTQALECITRHIESHPDDAEAHNDAGTILYCMGQSDQALEQFRSSMNIDKANPQVFWNLAETYIDLMEPDMVTETFPILREHGILSADLINRTANLYLQTGDKGSALETLYYSLSLTPDQDILHPMIDAIKANRVKVAFFKGKHLNLDFSQLLSFLDQRYTLRVCDIEDEDMVSIVQWADAGIVMCSDPLITSAINAAAAEAETTITLIGADPRIDIDQIAFDASRPRTKKIACIDNLRLSSNPMFLLQCMQKLNYIDNGYTMHFTGPFESDYLENYMKNMVDVLGLADVVTFEPMPVNLSEWLADKTYAASAAITSHDSFSVYMAMAHGLMPVIHRQPSDTLYFPEDSLFDISERFCEIITAADVDRQVSRDFAAENCSMFNQLLQINSLLSELDKLVDVRKGLSAAVNAPAPAPNCPAPAAADESQGMNPAQAIKAAATVRAEKTIFDSRRDTAPRVKKAAVHFTWDSEAGEPELKIDSDSISPHGTLAGN